MSCPLPVIEQISQTIVGRIRNVTRKNGYQVTVAAVVRPTKIGGYVPDHMLVVVHRLEAEDNPDIAFSGNPPVKGWSQPYLLELWVRQSDFDSTPADTYVAIFAAEVEKAITNPPGDAAWWTMAGMAINASFGTPQPIIDDTGAYSGISLTLTVEYRVDENNPYVNR